MLVCMSVDENGSAAKESAVCHTRGESEYSVVCRQYNMQVRGSTLALKPRADVTKSPKQGHQWPHKKD